MVGAVKDPRFSVLSDQFSSSWVGRRIEPPVVVDLRFVWILLPPLNYVTFGRINLSAAFLIYKIEPGPYFCLFDRDSSAVLGLPSVVSVQAVCFTSSPVSGHPRTISTLGAGTLSISCTAASLVPRVAHTRCAVNTYSLNEWILINSTFKTLIELRPSYYSDLNIAQWPLVPVIWEKTVSFLKEK